MRIYIESDGRLSFYAGKGAGPKGPSFYATVVLDVDTDKKIVKVVKDQRARADIKTKAMHIGKIVQRHGLRLGEPLPVPEDEAQRLVKGLLTRHGHVSPCVGSFSEVALKHEGCSCGFSKLLSDAQRFVGEEEDEGD